MRLLVVLWAAVLCPIVSAGEAEIPLGEAEIPLGEIWAYGMPGTKDIRDLEDRSRFKGMLWEEIVQHSVVMKTRWLLNANRRPPYGVAAERGFVVAGTGLEALKEANAILAEEKPRREFFDEDEELTIVFFCFESGKYVRLEAVTAAEREIVVKYRFEKHGRLRTTTHFALIPLGRLSAGNRYVKIERETDASVDAELRRHRQTEALQTVCRSFAFGVEKKEQTK